MFKTTEFYDHLTNHLVSPWRLYFLMGISFVAFALLIFVFPDALAYLAASFLMFNGILFLLMGFRMKSLRSRYKNWKDDLWVDVD